MMGPAEAMGTFLKVWRSEWAGLSRAQFAIAVSSHVNGRKAVTPRMVLRWGDGLPPSSTEELEGLRQVMARSGLSRRAVVDFRRTVFAGVVDLQYPELFPEGDFTARPHVDDVAEAMYEDAEQEVPNPVQLVATFSELRDALTSGPTSPGECRQAVAREAALCYLRPLVAGVAFHVSWRASADLCAANARVLGTLFGSGGLPGVCVNPYAMLARSLHTRGCHGRDLVSAKRLLELARARMAEDGHALSGGGDFLAAVANIARHEAVYPGLRREVDACWEAIQSSMWPDGVDVCRAALLGTALHEGLLAEAEEHLAGIESWREAGDLRELMWHDMAGDVQLAAGRFPEAQEMAQAGLAAAERNDNPFYQRWFARQLRECERAALAAAPRRYIPRTSMRASQ